MTDSRGDSGAAELPPYPQISALLNEDGTAVLTIAGEPEAIDADSVDAARELIFERVAVVANELDRPVRLSTIGPAGARYELAIDRDVRIDVLEQPLEATSTVLPLSPPSGDTSAPAHDRAPAAAAGGAHTRSRPSGPSRGRPRAVAAVLTAMAAVPVLLVIALSSGPPPAPQRNAGPSSRPAPGEQTTARREPAGPPAPSPQALAQARDAARARQRVVDRRVGRRRAAANRQAAQRAAQRAARRRAVGRRVARRRANARRDAPRASPPPPPPPRAPASPQPPPRRTPPPVPAPAPAPAPPQNTPPPRLAPPASPPPPSQCAVAFC